MDESIILALAPDIARSVYGYLMREDKPTADSFLRTSKHINFCYEAVSKGFLPHTQYFGRTLEGVFLEFNLVYNLVQKKCAEFVLSPEEKRTFDQGDLSVKVDVLLNLDSYQRSNVVETHDSERIPTPMTEDCPQFENTPIQEVIDKETFLSRMELGREEQPSNKTMSRSQSCGDLSTSQNEKTRRKQPRPKFFTPRKLLCHIPDELALNETFTKKLAETINNVREEIEPNTQDDLDVTVQAIVAKTQSDPVLQLMSETLATFDLLTYLKPSENVVRANIENIENSSTSTVALAPKKNTRAKPVKRQSAKPIRRTERNTIEFHTTSFPALYNPVVDTNIITKKPLRPIYPRPDPDFLKSSTFPVIVCQPLMPPLESQPPPTQQTIEMITIAEPITNASMPEINLLATPAPQVFAPVTKKQSSSTPRRNHIRVLEFETPNKGIDANKSMSCPKDLVNNIEPAPMVNEATKQARIFENITEKEIIVQDTIPPPKSKQTKSWDSDLRTLLPAEDPSKKKKPTKPRNKLKKPSTVASPIRVTRSKTIISPSKMGGTSKRSTFAISGEEEVERTPAKSDEHGKFAPEETPFTKLLRENVSSIDIDLSMLGTPFFPVTPGVAVTATPLHDQRTTGYSSGSSYYKPDIASPVSCSKRLERSEENLEDVSTESGRVIVRSPQTTSPLQPTEGVDNLETQEVVKESEVVVPCNANFEVSTTMEGNTIEVREDNVFSNSVQSGETLISSVSTGENEPKTLGNRECSSSVSPEIGVVARAAQKSDNTQQQIDEIVTKAKTIARTGRSSGKNMSFLKMQMITQCKGRLVDNFTGGKEAGEQLSENRRPLQDSQVPVKQQRNSKSKDKVDEVRYSDKSKSSSGVNENPKELNLAVTNQANSLKDNNSLSHVVVSAESSSIKKRGQPNNDVKEVRNNSRIPQKSNKSAKEVGGTNATVSVESLGSQDNHKKKQIPSKQPKNVKSKVADKTGSMVKARSSSESKENPDTILACSDSSKSSRQKGAKRQLSSTPKAAPKRPRLERTSESENSSALSSTLEKSCNKSGNEKEYTKLAEVMKNDGLRFVDDGQYPEASLDTKQRLWMCQYILSRTEVKQYLSASKSGHLNLPKCLEKMAKSCQKWLASPCEEKHPNVLERVVYFNGEFNKLCVGFKEKKQRKTNLDVLFNNFLKEKGSGDDSLSDSIDDVRGPKVVGGRTEEALVERSNAQKILQNIDVDQFLSRIHGQE